MMLLLSALAAVVAYALNNGLMDWLRGLYNAVSMGKRCRGPPDFCLAYLTA